MRHEDDDNPTNFKEWLLRIEGFDVMMTVLVIAFIISLLWAGEDSLGCTLSINSGSSVVEGNS